MGMGTVKAHLTAIYGSSACRTGPRPRSLASSSSPSCGYWQIDTVRVSLTYWKGALVNLGVLPIPAEARSSVQTTSELGLGLGF